MNDEGIEISRSAAYCPEQNGIAERADRTLLESAREILKNSGLPMRSWAEAISSAANVLNLFISPQSDTQTPSEIVIGQKPRVYHLRVFRCLAWTHVPDQIRNKHSLKAEKGILIGCLKRNQYMVWLIIRNIVIITRHVRIYEDQFPARMWMNDNEGFKEIHATQPNLIRTTQIIPNPAPPLPSLETQNQPSFFLTL